MSRNNKNKQPEKVETAPAPEVFDDMAVAGAPQPKKKKGFMAILEENKRKRAERLKKFRDGK